MFSLNSVIKNFNNSKLVSNLTDNYHKLKGHMSKKLTITQVLPKLYHIDFPQQQNTSQLLQHIGNCSYTIWNLSQYTYDDQFSKQMLDGNSKGTIKHLSFAYYSNLPFLQLIQTIRQIASDLNKSKTHCIYIHCQQGKLRSAVFLVCYVFYTGAFGAGDIGEDILYINKLLQISLEDNKTHNYKNQHILLKNLANYTTNRNFINKQKLQLHNILVKNSPKIISQGKQGKILGLANIQIMLEVKCGSEVLHNSIHKNNSAANEQQIAINLPKTKNIILSDEFLLILKYLDGKNLYNVLRIQLNTNFIFNGFARIYQQDIDISGHCLAQENILLIDLTFSAVKQLSKLAQMGKEQSKPKPKVETVDLLSGDGQEIINHPPQASQEQHFQWYQQQNHEIDEDQLNSKIEAVMKNMTLKEQERDLDKSDEDEDEEQDLQDYLSKLQSKAEG